MSASGRQVTGRHRKKLSGRFEDDDDDDIRGSSFVEWKANSSTMADDKSILSPFSAVWMVVTWWIASW
ncbi:unnamed protein product [Calypogeia fissa]